MKTSGKRKILITALGALMLAIGGLAAALFAARWAMSYEAPCRQPCQDLGPALTEDPVPLPEPKCKPFELTLELAKPVTKAHKLYTLFYKATLKNVSCYEFSPVGLESFAKSRQASEGFGLFLKVWDPSGVIVPTGMTSLYGSEYSEIIPYQDDPFAYEKLRSDPDLKMRDDDIFCHLKPGKSITTVESIFAPYTLQPVGRIEGDYVINGYAQVKADMGKNRPPSPPPGFQILDDYVFQRPGTYRIQAVFDGSDLKAIPVHPYRKYIPRTFAKLMHYLRDHGIADFFPQDDTRHYHVRAESTIYEFTVQP